MFNLKDLYKILLGNQKYIEDEYNKALEEALKKAQDILRCPYHSILYIDKKVPHGDFRMGSMASMFPDCEYCNPNGQTKTQQTQNNNTETSKPQQEEKQAQDTKPSQETKPNEVTKSNAKPNQVEKQSEKVKNICSYCPTDEEIEQENNKIQIKRKIDLQKLRNAKEDWKQQALDFEKYKQEVKNKPPKINWFYKLTPDEVLENNLSLSLFKHYAEQSGRNKSIYEIDIANTLKSLINKKNAFKLNTGDSVQERFLKDIVHGKVYFDNFYAMKDEVAFAIGYATLRGIFDGSIKRVKECKQSLDCQKNKYLVQGNIHYYFRDEFKDPYDNYELYHWLYNWLYKKLYKKFETIENLAKYLQDLDGVPFAITGEFNVSIHGMYYANGVEVTRGF